MKKLFNKLTMIMALIGVLFIFVAATPNMGLDLPVPGVTPGPQWSTMLNTALGVNVDQHNHTSGKGVQIPTAGINVQADFPFNGYNINNVRSCRLASQSQKLSSPGDVRNLFSYGGDLYYNNASGQNVQITSGSALFVGSTGGFGGQYISAGALASYLTIGNKYNFLGPASSAANIEVSGALNVLNGPNPALVPGLTVAGNATVGEIFSTTGANPRMSFFDSTAATNDFQWSVDAGRMSLNADTNNDGVFDLANIITATANNAISVNGLPSSGANFSVAGTSPSFQLGNDATAANNWHFVAQNAYGGQSLNLYNGNFGAGTLHANLLTTGEMAFNGSATPNREYVFYTPNEISMILGYSSDTNGRNYFTAQKSRGTQAAPTAVQNNDILGGFSAGGYDGTGNSPDSTAMVSYAAENWTPTAHGSSLNFYVTPLSSTSTIPAMSMQPNGDVLPGINATQDFGASTYNWADAWFSGTVNENDFQSQSGHVVTSLIVDGYTNSTTIISNNYNYDTAQTFTSYFNAYGGMCSGDGCPANIQTDTSVAVGAVKIATPGSDNTCLNIPMNIPVGTGVTVTNWGIEVTLDRSATGGNLITGQLYRMASGQMTASAVSGTSASLSGNGTFSLNSATFSQAATGVNWFLRLCCFGTYANSCTIGGGNIVYTQSSVAGNWSH